MPQVSNVKKVCEILEEAKIDSWFEMSHDILFVPYFEETGEIAERLESAGCHWEDSAGCWAMF